MKHQFDFVVTLKSPDFKIFDTISLLLCIIAIAFFGYAIVNGIDDNWKYILIIAIVIAQLVFNYFEKKKGKIITHWGAFFLIAVGFIILPSPSYLFLITSLLFFLSAFLERQLKFSKEIGFDKKGITFNNLPKKFTTWNKVANTILKDGLLTIDYKNNKLYQKEIQEYVSPEAENEFNQFCTAHLNKPIVVNNN